MKRPAVFFDRDNTLIASDGYLADPDGVILVDGAADAVARVRGMGFAAVVFSNQSGVARGLFGEEAVYAVNSRLDELLLEDNPSATIDRHEFCPYHPEGTVAEYRQASELRKPSPGMIHRAAGKLELDLDSSWVIGDAPRDIEAGHAAGCRTILLKVPGLPPSAAAAAPLRVAPHFVAMSLEEAVDLIERERRQTPVGGAAGSPGLAESPPPTPADQEPRSPEGGEVEAAPEVDGPALASAVDVSDGVGNGAGSSSTAPQSSGTDAAGDDEADAEESPEGARIGAPEETPPVIPSDDPSSGDQPGHDTLRTSGEWADLTPEEAAAAEPAIASEPRLTWGERMRAAKAHGLLPQPSQAEDPAPAAVAVEAQPLTSPAPLAAAPPPSLQEAQSMPQPTPPPAEPRSKTPTPSHQAPAMSAATSDTEPPPDAAERIPASETSTIAAARFPSSADRPASAAPRPVIPVDQTEPRPSHAETGPGADLSHLESLAGQILAELKRSNEPIGDFSVSKLVAGIAQVLSLAALVYAFFNRDAKGAFDSYLQLTIAFQTLTIALLIMGRQKP